jgi:PAS domain S-box-containing protein
MALIFPALFFFNNILLSTGVLANRLDYAVSHVGEATLALTIELLIAGLFAQVVAVMLPALWGGQGPLEISPAEKSLQARILYRLMPLALILLVTLMAGTWYIAGQAANAMIEVRMSSAAQMAAQNVPFFLETGQEIIDQLAGETGLPLDNPSLAAAHLEDRYRRLPFFRQLFLLDSQGELIAGYPKNSYNLDDEPEEERMAMPLVAAGLPGQQYTIPPAPGDVTARVSFMAPVFDEDGAVQAVLVGRTDLDSNPFTKPLLAGLGAFRESGGTGFLLDGQNRILVHPDKTMLMESYTGLSEDQSGFYNDTAPNGTRRLVYYIPAEGYDWAVALTVPAAITQKMALQIAVPLLGIILLVSLLGVGIVHFTLEPVTSSLRKLSDEAALIAQGKLEQPLAVNGDDELGALRHSFEQMRLSLKSRLDEQTRLLSVSQGVASSREITEAIQPILDAALATGASSARVVLVPSIVPEVGQLASKTACYSAGPAEVQYASLDEQILAFTRQQDRLVLGSLTRPRLFSLPSASLMPSSLLAVALKHENTYYGAFWVAYEQPHRFTNEEVRFLITLGNQAALAAANARLFQSSEVGRQRLAAILDSSPDPILVTDQYNRLLLANPAAWQVLGLGIQTDIGQSIESIITQKALVEMLRNSSEETQSIEIALTERQVFLATATPVIAEGQRVGRVCILRDVTQFKELDSIKSEFISTVSHDLRSPLSLIRGYSTMLEMVGSLNDQQVSYVQKILSSVEVMSRLVSNLLDLNRLGAGVGLKLEQFALQNAVEPVITALKAQAAQKRIQFSLELPSQATVIEADPALLQQAIYNLVDNAIKFNRNEGSVIVSAQVRSDRVIFEVKDSGIGISPMDQSRLFDRYQHNLPAGPEESRVTGLGLVIVKSIVDRHHGQVWVESQLGKGSTFYLAIPLRQPRSEPHKR